MNIRSPDDMHPICKPVGFWWLARTLVHQTLFEHSGQKNKIHDNCSSLLSLATLH
jgi:hypothetical protein